MRPRSRMYDNLLASYEYGLEPGAFTIDVMIEGVKAFIAASNKPPDSRLIDTYTPADREKAIYGCCTVLGMRVHKTKGGKWVVL